MKVYADTSALVAWFHPADSFAETVTEWCRDVSPDFFWNSILRAELRHGLRKISGPYGALAWHAYRASESSKKLRLHTQPVSALFEWADELSARYAATSIAGTWDFVHVAAAHRLRAEVFATCDHAQAELARLVGIKNVKIFRET